MATHGVESAAPRPVTPGSLWKDRYEPLEMIGEGSQGQVYRAIDQQHERIVALKVRVAESDAERAELLSEARMLLGLRPHPGVPMVRDDFFIDDGYVIVMDWIEGVNLANCSRITAIRAPTATVWPISCKWPTPSTTSTATILRSCTGT